MSNNIRHLIIQPMNANYPAGKKKKTRGHLHHIAFNRLLHGQKNSCSSTQVNLHEPALDHKQNPVWICTIPVKVQIRSHNLSLSGSMALEFLALYHRHSTIPQQITLYHTKMMHHPSCTYLRWTPPKPSIVKLVPHFLLQINGISFTIGIMIMLITTFPFLHNLSSLLLPSLIPGQTTARARQQGPFFLLSSQTLSFLGFLT